MIKKIRDDFPFSVKNQLKRDCGSLCCNPDCRIQTDKPNGKKHKTIGVAAHIHAAAPGGARFKSEMTSTERASETNGIWLCQNCARKIDIEESLYSAQLLFSWKKNAVKSCSENFGKPLLTTREVEAHTRKSVVAAAVEGLIKSVPKVHDFMLTSDAIYNLKDPNFNISTNFIDGVTVCRLFSKSGMPISVSPTNRLHADDFAQKMTSLIEKGKPFSMSGEHVCLQGPELFKDESLQDSSAKIEFFPAKRCISLSISFVDCDGAETHFCRLDAITLIGTEAFNYEFSLFSDAFKFYVEEEPLKLNCSVSYRTNFTAWNGENSDYLPGFEDMERFVELAGKNEKLKFKIICKDTKYSSYSTFYIKEIRKAIDEMVFLSAFVKASSFFMKNKRIDPIVKVEYKDLEAVRMALFLYCAYVGYATKVFFNNLFLHLDNLPEYELAEMKSGVILLKGVSGSIECFGEELDIDVVDIEIINYSILKVDNNNCVVSFGENTKFSVISNSV